MENQIKNPDYLKAQHAQEIKELQDKNIEHEERLIHELEARFANEIRLLKNEQAEEQKKLIEDLEVKYALEAFKLLALNKEREDGLISEIKAEQMTKTNTLILALLRTRSQRDRFMLAVSWIAIWAVAAIAIKGFVYSIFSKILTLACLAGFIGTIINLKHDLNVNTGMIPSELLLEKDLGRSSRLMVFGLISSVLLGLTLFFRLFEDPVQTQPMQVQTKTALPSVPTISSPEAKTAGNGGIFVGGISR